MLKKLLFYIFSLGLISTQIFGQQFCDSPKITDSFGSENPFINCNYPLNGKCLTLNATYPTFNETTSYSVSSETFSPYAAFNSGTPLNANADDLFLKKIVLPFNFCFFGNSYNELIIGTNGMLTFDSAQLGSVNYPNFRSTNPSASLPKNAIFGVLQDLVFSKDDDSEIYYAIIGSAPCRKLIINYYKGRIVGCDQTSTSQIVLSEGSNNIEVFVDEKPLPCATAKFNESLLGIMNGDGSLGYSPATRNTGTWAASKEAWKFTPTGAAIIPKVNWYNSNNQNIGGGNSVTVCPEENENYTVKVSYAICGTTNLVLEKSSAVTFAPDFPLAKDYTKIFCGNSSFDVNLDDYRADLTPQNPNNLIFSFHNSLADAQSGLNPQPKNLILSSNKTYFVRIQNPSDPLCFRTSVLKLTLISNSLITSNLEICDNNNDGIEKDYLLSLFDLKLFSAPLNGSIHYFLSQSDADNDKNEVTQTDIRSGTQLFVNYKTQTCNQTFGPITLTFLPSPTINSPIDFVLTTCDFKDNDTEPFDFLLNIAPLISTDPNVKFSFYDTYADAISGSSNTEHFIHEGKYAVYARVESPGGCFSVATINLDITFIKIIASEKSVYICFNGEKDISVNLDDYSPEMLVSPLTGITTTYFATAYDAEYDQNPLSNLQTITDNGNFVSTVFWVKFADSTGCYALKALSINLVHVVIAQSNFLVCDLLNDGVENVNLSTLNSRIVGSQTATVTYYSTLADAQNNTNPITQLSVANSAKLFVRILSYDCYDVFEININLVPTPVVTPEISLVKNSVCDNNNNGEENVDLTQFESQIYTGNNAVSFSYFTTYNSASNSFSGLIVDPKNYSVKGTATVFAKISFQNGGCFSVSKIDIKLNFLAPIILKNALLQKCDFNFNLNETFNLDDALPQLFTQSENSIPLANLAITFYATEADANAGNPAKQIATNYTTSLSNVLVWARFTSKSTSCYSVSPIRLQTFLPPKALKSTINNVCDENLDGLYDVNLLAFTENMVNQSSPENKFSFYYSESDAKTAKNAIPNPESFNANPFPTRLWVRIENIAACFDTAYFDLNLGKKLILDNYGPFTVTNTCDIGNDGVENIDVTQFQSQIYSGNATFEYFPSLSDLNNNSNKISNPQTYLFNENSSPKTIFVKISAPGFCPEKVVINLALKKTPMFTLPDFYFCPDGFVNIQPDFSALNIVKFEWIDPSGKIISTNNEVLNINTEGVYTINVTAANGCSFTTNFKVIKYEVPTITNLIFNGNSATVLATGSKTILYSIDGIHYQTANVFNDLPSGVVTFYVKFLDSICAPITKQGLVLDIINAFSPNGDGINDTWIIDNLYVFDGQKATLKIFDRYQKLIFQQESASRLEWDGKENKRTVPTDSYWYILTLPDGRLFNGWILLKNRN